MKEFDQVHRRLQPIARQRSDERRPHGRRHRRASTSARTTRSSSRTHSRPTTARRQSIRRTTRRRSSLGELFLRKYNFEEAQTAFDEVLQTNPNDPRALLGAARRLQADGQAGGDSLLRAALTVNPEYVGRARLHAEVLLDLEDYAAAQVDIDRALKVNPVNERALAVAAAIKYLTHDQAGFETLRQRALAADPRDAESVRHARRVGGGRAALQVRRGFRAAGRRARRQGLARLERARHEPAPPRSDRHTAARASTTSFKGDPYNVWVKNTLDLLDTYKNYDLIDEPALSVHDREGRVADPLDLPARSRGAGVHDVREEVRVQSAAADPNRGLSKPRRLLGAHGRSRRTRRAGRELRDDARVRLAGGEGRRSVQLGLDRVARAGAHVHARKHGQPRFRGGSAKGCRCTRSITRGPAGAST